MQRWIIVLLLAGTLLASCTPLKNLVSVGSGNGPGASSQDADMNAATAQAQKTLPAFIKALQAPTASQRAFSIKVRFPYGTGQDAEQIWVSHLSYANNEFQGTLDNAPVYANNLHLGDKVSVDPKAVSDWMIVDNNTLLGGFTIHALRNRMNAADRAQFDAQSGVTIPDQPAIP